ncbi:hypothetical protein GG344DRAFT_61341 [Lentinula edodes]|nr:hypothetical protein GG344DRAFT_61341 [Lentinula edodes]
MDEIGNEMMNGVFPGDVRHSYTVTGTAADTWWRYDSTPVARHKSGQHAIRNREHVQHCDACERRNKRNSNENRALVIPSYHGYMGPGDEHGPQDKDVGNAELVMAALQRRFSRARTTEWNYFTTNSGQLWIRWCIDIELHERQNFAAEVEGMGDLAGKMFEKHIGMILSLTEAPQPGAMFQERMEIGRGRVEKEFDEAALEYIILRASTITGDRPHPTDTRRGDLFATALARHFSGVRTMSWNFFINCSGKLWLKWVIHVELYETQDMKVELKNMEVCLGLLWNRHISVTVTFIDVPRGPTKEQKTETLSYVGGGPRKTCT